MQYRSAALVLTLAFLALPLAATAAEPHPAQLIRLHAPERAVVEKLNFAGADIAGAGRGWLDVVVRPEDRRLRNIIASVSQEVVLQDVNTPFERFRAVPDLGTYHTMDEVTAEVQQTVLAHPDIVQAQVIGKTVEGRDILAVCVSDNPSQDEGEPQLLFMGAAHAREWIGVEAPLAILQHLAANYGTDAKVTDLVNSRRIWILPVINVDGVNWSQTNYQMWRKNRRKNVDNSFGVDLNRNWGNHWGGEGASDSPNSDTFRGTAAFSEPETAAVRDFLQGKRFVASLDFHSYSELCLWPWGWTEEDPADVAFFAKHGSELAKIMGGYTPEQSSDLYVCSGVSSDYFYGDHGMLSFTFELGKQFIPEEPEVPGIRERVVKSALYMLEHCADPFPLVLHDQLGPTIDPTGPYAVQATFNRRHHPTFQLAGMVLVYPAADGEVRVAMDAGAGDVFTALLPGTGLGHRQYRLELAAQDGAVARFPVEGWYGFDVVDKLYLLVDDDRGRPYEGYYAAAFEALGLPARVWDTKKLGPPTFKELAAATAVVWFCGDDSQSTLEKAEQDLLRDYLGKGGHLLLFGQDIGYDIKDEPFYRDVLKAKYLADNSQVRQLAGAPGSFLAGGSFSLAQGGDNVNQAYPDAFEPLAGATALLSYVAAEAKPQYGALTVESGKGRLAFFGFGLEGVRGAESRRALLEAGLGWLARPTVALLVRADALGRLAAAGGASADGLAARRALDGLWESLPDQVQAAGGADLTGWSTSGVEPSAAARFLRLVGRAKAVGGR